MDDGLSRRWYFRSSLDPCIGMLELHPEGCTWLFAWATSGDMGNPRTFAFL